VHGVYVCARVLETLCATRRGRCGEVCQESPISPEETYITSKETHQHLLETRCAAQTASYGDTVATGIMLQEALRFHHRLQQAAHLIHQRGVGGALPATAPSGDPYPRSPTLSVKPPPGDPLAAHTASLRWLLGLRARFQRWVSGTGPALEVREIVEATDTAAKWCCSGSSPLESHVGLVCLDSLLALQHLLLCGNSDLPAPPAESSCMGEASRSAGAAALAARKATGMARGEAHKQHLLEDIEAVTACIHSCLTLVLGWWSAQGTTDEAQGTNDESRGLLTARSQANPATDSLLPNPLTIHP